MVQQRSARAYEKTRGPESTFEREFVVALGAHFGPPRIRVQSLGERERARRDLLEISVRIPASCDKSGARGFLLMLFLPRSTFSLSLFCSLLPSIPFPFHRARFGSDLSSGWRVRPVPEKKRESKVRIPDAEDKGRGRVPRTSVFAPQVVGSRSSREFSLPRKSHVPSPAPPVHLIFLFSSLVAYKYRISYHIVGVRRVHCTDTVLRERERERERESENRIHMTVREREKETEEERTRERERESACAVYYA